MGEKPYNDFRDLEVWKRCRDIRKETWALCKSFPDVERFRLSDQMIKASRSATACIAEGYGRYHFQENIQFCRQSRGSLYELVDHIDVSVECGYVDGRKAESLIGEIKTAIRILNGYIKYLRQRKQDTL